MPPRTCLFTIASKNYLAHVRTLLASVARHHPEFARVFVLCDEVDGYFDPAAEDFQTILAKDLEIDRFRHVAFQYSVVELNTAIKPFVVQHLMARHGFEQVIYLDPDIRVFRPLDELLELLAEHELVLTPHITAPLPQDGRVPDEKVLLRAGSYNLGFGAFQRTAAVERLLAWWSGHLARECYSAVSEGLFVDQRWMDLAPGMVPATAVLRHPGYNAAYWNLDHRPICQESPGTYRAAGEPLAFFHFSGFDPRVPRQLSKYCDRFDLVQVNADTQTLFGLYSQELLGHGFYEVLSWPYAYAKFRGGPRIPECCRRYFGKNLFEKIPTEQDPFDPASGSPSVLDLFRQPLNGSVLNGYALAVHQTDREVQTRFPEVPGGDTERFRAWLVGMQGGFHDAAAEFLVALRGTTAKPSFASRCRMFPAQMARRVIRTAQRQQALVNLLPVSLRQRVGKRLFSTAYGGRRVDRASNRAALLGSPGVNLFGTLSEPIGTGEAARASWRALKAVGVPVTPVPLGELRLVNGEPAPPRTLSHCPHAVNLCHVNADGTDQFVFTVGEQILAGHYNIAYWAWELEHFPPRWDRYFDYYHEIWAMTTFMQQSVAQRSPIPVIVMPASIQVDLPPRDYRAQFGIPADRFAALCMFDVGSFVERKNPMAAIRALKAAASGDRRPFLVIKLGAPERNPEAVAALREEVRDLDCLFLDAWLSREETWGLIDACDTVVSLHRSEGFGLILAEAMALGKPVVATGYSGNMDFMTADNSFPVRYDLVTIAEDIGPYPAGAVWADPDVAQAAEMLRGLLSDPSRGRAVGERARRDIATRFSPAVIGQRIRQRLEALRLLPAASQP